MSRQNSIFDDIDDLLKRVRSRNDQRMSQQKKGRHAFGFFKETRDDLITPYLHWMDEEKLVNVIESTLNTKKEMADLHSSVVSNSVAAKAALSGLTTDQFTSLLKALYKQFPKHMVYDIQKLYYYDIEKINFNDRNNTNGTKFSLLERSNNPVGKIMTHSSHLKSMVFTKYSVLYYLIALLVMQQDKPGAQKQVMENLSSEKSADNKIGHEYAQEMLDKTKSLQNHFMNMAQQTVQMIEENIDQEMQQAMYEDSVSGMSLAGMLSPTFMKDVKASLENVNLNMSGIKKLLKKLLDKSLNYFATNEKATYTDLFDADSIAGLDEYFLLHPKLRKIFIEDIQLKETEPIGKIDLYIDISSSMGEGCGVKDDRGYTLSKLEFAKVVAARLKTMNLLNNLYLFNSAIHPRMNNMVSIAMIKYQGGTSITNVVNHIIKMDNNAIVLTDAEDSCRVYSDKAFFIGVNGAKFYQFASAILKKYAENEQMIMFDGQTISKIDEAGRPIKSRG